MTENAWTPYSTSQQSGHQGEASEDAEPGRRSLIEIAREELRLAGRRGLTWRELAATFGLHHGQASSALSNLHRTGGAVRLSERREGSGVYVTPLNIDGRATVAHRSQRKGISREQAQEIVREWVDEKHITIYLTDNEIDDLIGRF
jgi:hypothetical protein